MKGYLRETSEKTDVKNSYVCMMYANTEPPVTALEAVGKIWAAGFRVDFKSMAENEEQKPCVLVDMPAYPWNHSKSHWHESHLGAAGRFREHAREDIIGAPVSDWTIANPRWRGFLRVKENPWLRDHKVQGTILYPAAGMVASVVQAASQLVPKATKGNSELDKLFQGYELREVEIPQAMVIPESAHGLEFVVAFQEVEPLRVFEFKITSKALNASWQTNASGTVVLRFAADPAVDAELAVAEQATEAATVEKFHQELAVQQELCTDKVDTADFYVNLDLMGMNYGPQFQNVAALAKGAGALVSTVQVPNTAEIMPRGFQYPHIIHPAVLDAIFHSVFAIGGGDPMVPSHIDSIFVARNFPNTPGETLSGFVTARKSGPRTASAEIVMQRDDQKLPVVVARQLTFTSLGNVARSLDYLSDHRELCSTVIHVRDVDMVTSEEVKNGVGLREWISGITYKYPGMAVLQISGDDYDDYDGMVFTAFILAMRNAVGPECTRSELVRMARYTITDQKCLEICRGLLDGKLGEDMKKCMEFTPADAENAVKYDLVITSAKGLELALARAKPHAFLLVYGPHQAPGDSGFEKRHTVYGKDANDKTVEFTLYRSRPAPVDKSRVEMVLFAPPELEQLANNLAQVLAPKASSITVETTLGGPAVSALGDKYCISLWDLTGRESVVVATEDGFNAFKEMCKRARGILWVMSTWSAAEIRKSMFYGLARAIRSENPQRNVIIADVELGIRQRKSRSVLEKLANGLAEAVDNSLLRASTSASGEIGHETEYQYDATTGVWTIPRLVSLPRVSKYLETETESIQDTLLCPGMKMSLRLGAPGASEPVYFEEDEHCENLAEHDVELRVTKLAFTGAQVQSPRYAGYGAEIAFAFAGRVVRMGDRKASPGGMNGNGTKRTQSDYDDKIEIGAPCIALSSKGVQSYITVDRSQVCRVPHGMQIGEALGLAAYYLPSLFVFEKVVSFSMAGKTVLVIGGGSLAQAAVDVASILGAHVYVAVQDSRSMTVFRDRFGLTLGRDLIADDGGHSLASKLHAVCKGGFDVIFNTSMTAVVPLGQNILSPRGVAVFLPGYAHDISVPPRGTLYRLDMAQLIEDEPALMGTCLRHTFQLSVTSCFGRDRDGRAVNGCNSPSRTYSLTGSPCMMYGIGQLEKAIKTHDHSVGGAVISLDDSHLVRMIPRRRVSARSVISPSHTYLIVGGTSGLGLEMARRLVLLGSRDITLASRTGNEATARKIAISLRLLAKDGNLKVRALAMDVTKPTSVADALRTLESDPNIPPVRGVIVSAACLADAVFDNMSYQAFRHALDPKVDGTLNVLKHFIGGLDKDIPNGGEGPAVRLHHVRRHAKEGGGNGLDFFITLSSAAGIIGNRGQSNYSAGNSFQDGLAQYLARHADELGPGFTFTSIDLGPVLGAGMVANDPVTKKLLARSGFIFVRLQDVGELVERAIVGRRAATGETRNVANEALPPQVVVGSGTGGIIHQNKPSDPFWARTPIFRVLNRVDLPRPVLYPGVPKDDMDVTQQAKASDSSISMKALLAASKSEDEAAYTILEGIRSLLAVRLNMGSKDEVLADMTPATLGVDSLVAVEVVNWAFRDLDIEISTFDVLMEGRTLTDLAWIMANKSDWGTAESGKAPTQEDSKAAVNGSI